MGKRVIKLCDLYLEANNGIFLKPQVMKINRVLSLCFMKLTAERKGGL